MNSDKPQANGFIVGKHWMGVTEKMWKEDIKEGLLFPFELYDEGRYPIWWLDEVLFGVR